jgi:hypothetical protein
MPAKHQSCNATMCAALALSCAGLGMTADRVSAEDTLSGFYASTDAGLNLASDLNAPAVSISLRPGVRGDASLGRAWQVADHFSAGAELEAGILYNSLNKAKSQVQSVSVGGSLMDVPLLAHAVVHWQFHQHWGAYAGIGAGCAFSSLHIDSAGGNFGLNGTKVDFAWQAMTGFRYRFGPNEIGVGYEYFSFHRSGVQTVGNNTILASYTFNF